MELNDLKSDWQTAGKSSKSESQLLKMTQVRNHPSLKKIRFKLVFEAVVLLLFALVYYDWFDGHEKPLFANILLTGSLVLIMLQDIVGYIAVAKPIAGANLKIYVQECLVRIQRLSILSIALSFAYGLSLLIFFSSIIAFDTKKYILIAGLFLLLLGSIYVSYRMWSSWIVKLRVLASELDR